MIGVVPTHMGDETIGGCGVGSTMTPSGVKTQLKECFNVSFVYLGISIFKVSCFWTC